MKDNEKRERGFANGLLLGAAALTTGLLGAAAPAAAQDSDADIVVTGSRIVRQDFVANSPIATVTQEQIVGNADVTMDTYLNTLPQVNPAGTTSSNNPGNNGQSNINLRGLGANRNLVLIDGRRPMVSANNLTVDINTIPAAMIETIEVITGGAGATYGADAIAGAVNIRLRNNFEGADFRASYSNQMELWDAEEYNVSAVIGGNFADGRGNAIFGFDRSFRQPLVKAQRPFSANATSTTGTPPEGAISWSTATAASGGFPANPGNPVPESAVDALFGTYGFSAADVTNQSGRFGFNRDGSIIFYGIAGPGFPVLNFRDPITVDVNSRFYPDFYSYNFDAPNALVLPLDRYSFLFDVDYETESGVTFFAQAGWTEYNSSQKLAPTPLPSVSTRAPGENTNVQVASALVVPGSTPATGIASLIVPVTNPFVASNPGLMSLLNARTGDDLRLVGSGANEPFLYAFRPLGFGARESIFQNTVVQFLVGARGEIGDSGWDWEAYVSEGRTEIDITQNGNIDTQRLSDILANPTSGGSVCATWNPFGNNPLPAACRTYLESPVSRRQAFTQQIAQGFIRGDAFELPAGPLSMVFGAEYRGFEYTDRFLSSVGPFSGFNVGSPEGGKNDFFDVFAEALIPIASDLPLIQNLEVGLGYRRSTYQFTQTIATQTLPVTDGPQESADAYKIELNWEPVDFARFRASYQRSVRAPNFQELFQSSQSFPQIFDPCSNYSAARNGANGAALATLCQNTGVGTPATFAATPGGQAQTTTSGNLNLDAEEADTISVGVVLNSPWENQWLSRLRGSVDYYDIEITGPILAIDPNIAIADCYNYFGNNPTYTVAGNQYCAGLVRSGGAISRINSTLSIPGVPAGNFPGTNGGLLATTGVDIQVDYGMDLEWLGLGPDSGSLSFNALITHVMTFERQEAASLPVIDYAGTISYFGAGLGTSFPEWKGTFTTVYDVGPFAFMARGRYIGEMENRITRQFPGERNFGTNPTPTGVDSIWYWDASARWNITEMASFTLGVNNVTDEETPVYSPNVQSGTDPSTYDIIGRRAFASVNLRF